MADPISNALRGVQAFGQQELKSKGPIKAVGPAVHEAPTGDNGLARAMRGFMQTGADAYSAVREQQKSRAEERSNEIIRKMTPEQRRQAIADGTLLYKDDKDAMVLLRQKTGRNAAYEVDADIQQKVQAGQFRTRKELDEYRQQRLADRAKSYAMDAGIDPEDVDYQRGFNADIVQRNASLYDLHGQFLSKNLEAQASIESRNDLDPIMSDPSILGASGSGNLVASYIRNGLTSGEIPTDRQAIDAITMVAQDAIARDGGEFFLKDFKQQKIKVNGAETTIENLLGPEVYQNLEVKAATKAYERNNARNETFQLGIANALAQSDPATGWQLLQKLEQDNNWIQVGDQVTPQRQQLTQAKAQMIEAVRRNSANGQAALVKAAQADNRQQVIAEAFEKRMADGNISVDPKFLPVDENTGEFKDSDMATFAHNKLNQIDGMNISDAEKDAKKMAYLKADYRGGPFQAAFGTLTQDAQQEWTAAILQGNASGLKRFTELQRVYAANPSLMSQLYPEQAGLMEKMRLMGENGLDPQILIDAERNKPKTEDERRFREEQWAAIKNDSATADVLKYIPGSMEEMARAVFDANTTLTGDSSAASKAVTDFLKKNTVSFTNDNGWTSANSFHGMLSKSDLQVDPNNLDSWQAGEQLIKETMADLQKDSVWGASGLSVSSRNGTIIIQNLTGQRMLISPEQFQQLGQQRAAKAREEAEAKAQADLLRQQQMYNEQFRGAPRKMN
ncbi:internal virion protein [Pseudomonas phage phi15]|uniref:Virion structural protein n=1 Tax=Pseudomonas phage phi15 TaxID=988656 RepID=F0V703_9CAUD|nr:internal virion protein [Pseudomonas phage phi15]CBZ42015.1 virion structural protein [Pseudomonas phage phi15]